MSIRVKICGITRVEDAVAAAQAGADAIGLVFFEKSPRHLPSLLLAEQITRSVGPFVTVVGLFVDPDPDYLKEVLSKVALNCLQFHGNESPEFCRASARPYIKALKMKPGLAVESEAARYADARGILFDTYVPGLAGGTGLRFDWSLLQNAQQPFVLAGGLDADNVGEALALLKPAAVDVSGGVESAPGIKDANKIRRFIEKVKEVGEQL